MDHVLDRLLTTSKHDALTPIPWPAGLAPQLVGTKPDDVAPLSEADVLIVTWTAAEFAALADVWTPGHPSTAWNYYTNQFASYESQLTGRSPAKNAKRLGEYAYVTVGDKKVVLFHSQLHLSTDGTAPPIVRLWQQLISQVQPSLVISTGTAGGIGMSEVLGDVFVCNGAKFNCTETFKDKPWAQAHFGSITPLPGYFGANFLLVDDLIKVNAGQIPKEYAPRTPVASAGGDVETVDYFGFDDTDDSYGIVSNDANARTEEMDDATLPLALGLSNLDTPWFSVRNASDPEVPSSIGTLEEQKRFASAIYEKYGYWTTVGSAITCWALVADLDSSQTKGN